MTRSLTCLVLSVLALGVGCDSIFGESDQPQSDSDAGADASDGDAGDANPLMPGDATMADAGIDATDASHDASDSASDVAIDAPKPRRDGGVCGSFPDPGPSGTATLFGLTNTSMAIAHGPDCNVWVVSDATTITRITPDGVTQEFTIPRGASASMRGIAAGADGNLWFTESVNPAQIGMVTPSGVMTEYNVGLSANAEPYYIALGPDGNMWFTEHSIHKIGRITPQGTITEFSTGISTPSFPYGIVGGPDGNVWFTEAVGNVGRITPAGLVTEFPGLGVHTDPEIVLGPDGNLWVSSSGGVFKVSQSGTVTPITPVPQTLSTIARGPDGNLWFAEQSTGKLARMTPVGVVSEFSLGANVTNPYDLVVGADGNLWVDVTQGIVRFVP